MNKNLLKFLRELKQYGIWSYLDSMGAEPSLEFRHATSLEATVYYKNLMIALADVYPGFSLWYYFAKFLILFAVSSIPSLLAFLSSLFAVSFPITAPITAIVLVFLQWFKDMQMILLLPS